MGVTVATAIFLFPSGVFLVGTAGAVAGHCFDELINLLVFGLNLVAQFFYCIRKVMERLAVRCGGCGEVC